MTVNFVPRMQKWFNMHKLISTIQHVNRIKSKDHAIRTGEVLTSKGIYLLHKFDDLSLIPGIHIKMEGEN